MFIKSQIYQGTGVEVIRYSLCKGECKEDIEADIDLLREYKEEKAFWDLFEETEHVDMELDETLTEDMVYEERKS